MKKVNLKGKLSLSKEIISKLNGNQMGQVKGGAPLKTEVNCNHTNYVSECIGCPGESWRICNTTID
jgi:hypothetical protein